MSDLRTGITTRYQDDRAQVDGSMKSFVEIKLLTSAENRGLLKDFSNTMPFSRRGATVNQDVVTFIAEPVALSPLPIRDNVTIITDTVKVLSDFWWLLPILGLCVLLMAIAGIAGARHRKRRKRLEADGS